MAVLRVCRQKSLMHGHKLEQINRVWIIQVAIKFLMSLREIFTPEVLSQYRSWVEIHARPDTYEHDCPGKSDYEICVKVIDSKEEVVATNYFETIVNANDWLNKAVESMNAEDEKFSCTQSCEESSLA